jgi:hypothetical protein
MSLPTLTHDEGLALLRKASPEAAAAFEAGRDHSNATAASEIRKSEDSGAKAIADSLATAHRLCKSESPSERKRGHELRRSLELAALTAANPEGARAWLDAHAS